jgi:hypothetical protein
MVAAKWELARVRASPPEEESSPAESADAIACGSERASLVSVAAWAV